MLIGLSQATLYVMIVMYGEPSQLRLVVCIRIVVHPIHTHTHSSSRTHSHTHSHASHLALTR